MSARHAHAPVFGAQARENERARRSKSTRPQLKLVEHKPKQRRRIHLSFRARIAVCIATASVLLFGLVAFHVLLTQQQYSLSQLESKANEAQTEYERQRLRVAQLESPSRITNEAINRLGMVPASKVTPVTPGPAQMPKTVEGDVAPVPNGAALVQSDSFADDSGSWNAIKPHLSSSISGQ